MKPQMTSTRFSWSNSLRLTVLTAALGFSGQSALALDSATTMSSEQYKATVTQAKSDYEAAWNKCNEMTGTERMHCRKEAKAARKRVLNDAARNRHSANDATWAAGNAANISADPSNGNATAGKGVANPSTSTSSQGGTVGAQGYTGTGADTNSRSNMPGTKDESMTGNSATGNNDMGNANTGARMDTPRDARMRSDPNNDNRGRTSGAVAPR